MDPLRVTARHYRNWRELEWRIPEGCTAIVGANGAGKSSLVNLISVCLYGGRDLARSVTHGETEMEVTLRFEAGGHTFDVRRWVVVGVRARAGCVVQRDGVPVAAESVRDADARLARVVGVDRAVFHASSFLGQGEGGAWTRADPRERKRVLARVLGLEVWERVHARAVEEQRLVRVVEERLRLEWDQAESLVGRGDWAADVLRQLEPRVEGLRGEVERLRDSAEAARELASVRAELERWRRVRLPTGEERALAGRVGEVVAWRVAVAELAVARRDVARLEEARDAARQAFVAADADMARRWQLVEAVRESARCDACGQPLPSVELDKRVAVLRRERDVAVEVARAADANRERCEAAAALQVGVVGDVERVVARLSEGDAAMIEQAAEMVRVAERIGDPGVRVAELEARARQLEARIVAPGRAVERAERELEAAVREAERERVAVDVADEARVRVEALRGELAVVEAPRVPLDVLVRASGRDGVALRVIDRVALPRVAEVANRVLDGLGGALRVELRTSRALAGGGERDALDVIVRGELGEAAYEELSGGERTRVDLALRLGLANLLASRRGAEIGVLVVDEPDWLDSAGLDALASVLAGGAGGAYRRVLVVSHAPGLADAFDRVVRVESGSGGPVLV